MARYDDWTVAQKHREIVKGLTTKSLRAPQLHRTIKGVVNGRLTPELTAGVWMMPIGSEIGRTYSSVHDVNRRTLLVAAVGNSSRQSSAIPELMAFAERVRTAFANRRVMEMVGELYSRHEVGEYDVDDQLARKYDVLQLILTSRFREDR